jgi:hypothetical protein
VKAVERHPLKTLTALSVAWWLVTTSIGVATVAVKLFGVALWLAARTVETREYVLEQ